MEGFKKPAKMQCFKEGGSVQYESRKEHKEEMSADVAQDKKIVKKAFAMHDKQEHKGEKTDLSSLKKGGRAKKQLGTARKFIKPAAAPSGAKGGPNKYKVGGTVSNVYEAKKKSGDLDAIEAVKNIKPGLAAAPSKAAVKSKDTPAKFCGGKSVKKYAAGGDVMSGVDAKLSALDKQRALEKMKRAQKYLGPAQQSELIKQSPEAAGLTPPMPAPAPGPMPAPAPGPMPAPGAGPAKALPIGAPTPGPMPGPAPMKKGGKAKRK